MARPLKDPVNALTKTARFRVTEAELIKLETLATLAGSTVSDYCRARTLNAKPRRQTITPERQALIRALGQLGNIRADINQLVKDRQQHFFVKPDDVEAALQAITDLADRILNDLSGDGD